MLPPSARKGAHDRVQTVTDALPSRSAIGRRVKDLRLARGKTLRSLAGQLAVSPATLSAIENGHTGLSSVRLAQLAALLEVPAEELLTSSPATARTRYGGASAALVASEDAWREQRVQPTSDADRDQGFDWRHFAPLMLDPPLAAALSAFLDLGYHGATMRHIAQRAGLSVPGIYHYYPGKHDLLVAILDLTMDDLIRRSAAARAEGRTPVERFARLVECLALYHTHRRELGFVGASEMRSLAPQHRERVAAARREQQRMVDEEVAAATAQGDFGTDQPREAARAVVTMCTAMAQWYSIDGPSTAEEIASQYVQFALDLVRCPVARRPEAPRRSGHPERAT